MEKIYWVSTIDPATFDQSFWFFSTLEKAEGKACRVSKELASTSIIYLFNEGEELDQAKLLQIWKNGKRT